MGFPDGSDVKESACNAGEQIWSLGQEDPLEKGKATHSSILTWRIPWQATVHGVAKSWIQLSEEKEKSNKHLNNLFISSG